MSACIMKRYFKEETIPVINFTSWVPNQSECYSAYKGQSYCSNENENAAMECFRIISHSRSSSLDDVNTCSSAYATSSVETESYSRVTTDSLASSCEDLVDGTDSEMSTHSELLPPPQILGNYCKELPCLSIIINDYDSNKTCQADIDNNNMDYDKHSAAAKDITSMLKWHDVISDDSTEFDKENITPPSPPPESFLEAIQEVNNGTLSPADDTHLDAEDTTQSECESIPSPRLDANDRKPSLSADDLEKLKHLALRLKLQTRRGSYTSWQSRLASRLTESVTSSSSDDTDTSIEYKPKTPSRGAKWVQEQLDTLRRELKEIRKQDESLARQFIALRSEIQRMRLERSTSEVKDMVDEAQWTIAEKVELVHVCDKPRYLDKSPLLTVGVTKMNLTERRYSVF